MEKTELGFYLISDEEYYGLKEINPDVTYVLISRNSSEYLVLKDGKFMGKIDSGMKKIDLAHIAMETKKTESNKAEKEEPVKKERKSLSSLDTIGLKGEQKEVKAKASEKKVSFSNTTGAASKATKALKPNINGLKKSKKQFNQE